MSASKVSQFCIFAALLVCATLAFTQNAGQHAASIDNFITNLPGYTIFEGSAFQIDYAKMCCDTKLLTALFFNKSAPYVAFSVRDVESQLDQLRELPIFQLRADEAIVA